MISIINEPIGGCEYHRQLAPNGYLASMGAKILQTNSLRICEEKGWDWKVCQFNNSDRFNHLPIARHQGLKIWVDLDDIWELETRHPYFETWRKFNRKGITEKLVRDADVVTCANDRLAEHCFKFNKNAHHVPNFISPLEPQFQIEYKGQEGPVKFGWIGAKFHTHDVALLASSLDKLYCDRSLGNMYRVIYGGFINQYSIEVTPDPLSERIAYYLKGNNSKNSAYHYGQINATDHTRYGFMYGNLDVALAPLEDTRYNSYKSELKIIEAGHYGIPVIASDVHPYNKVVNHGVNGFLVKKEKEWLKYMKFFINEPDQIKKMGDELKKTIKEKFNPEVISNQRLKIIESL